MPQGAPEKGELMVLIDNDKKEANTNRDCGLSFVNPSLSMQKTQGVFFLFVFQPIVLSQLYYHPGARKIP